MHSRVSSPGCSNKVRAKHSTTLAHHNPADLSSAYLLAGNAVQGVGARPHELSLVH